MPRINTIKNASPDELADLLLKLCACPKVQNCRLWEAMNRDRPEMPSELERRYACKQCFVEWLTEESGEAK